MTTTNTEAGAVADVAGIAIRIVEEGGPHEWGYRDPVTGEFISDPWPFEAAAYITEGWRAFDSAPRDGRLFLALNHDHEVWVCKFIDDRIVFRMNGRYEPRKFTNVIVDGETLLREDVQWAKDGECWRSDWTFWCRLYEFKPLCWLPLPRPPAHLSEQGATAGVVGGKERGDD